MSDIIPYFVFCYDISSKNQLSGNSLVDEMYESVDDSDNILSIVSQYIGPKKVNVSLIGVSSSGKSSFIERLKNDKFIRSYFPSKSLTEIRFVYNFTEFTFFDHGGQYMYNDDSRLFSKNSDLVDIIVLMIDNTSKISSKFGMKWLNEIKENKKYLIVVNKCDLPSSVLHNHREDVIRISVKTGDGIDRFIEKIIN